MKKLNSLLLWCLVTANAIANPIAQDKAMQIAADFLPDTETFTLVSNSAENRVKAFGGSSVFAPFYVYSRGEGQGYVIIAGDDCLPTILGYTESGDFDADNVPPALQAMFDSWSQSVAQAQATGTNTPRTMLMATNTRSNIKPLMTSHWHQSSPYNDRCPYIKGTTNRALTGCVATAASQILYYWRKDLPSTLQNTTPTYGYGDAPVTESAPKGTALHWDLMKDSYSGSESATVKDAVAEFVFATGAATWLTYGSSTSGNIEKIPDTFNGFFGMRGGTVHYRTSYSQENWVQLIYDELLKGHPVMYTGQHETQGGHAVVVHGYQKTNDLFYFNFGWGGQSDGYYTVDTETGMNGFKDYQSCLIGAYPKTRNISAEITPPATVYAQRTNHFSIKIDNNSTLPVQGVYLFASTSSTKPSELRNAKSSDLETIIPSGSSATVNLTCKPSSTRTWYITATDADLNVLAQLSLTPEQASSNIAFSSIYCGASSEKDVIDGEEYNKFYSTKASIMAEFYNNDKMDYEGTAKIDIYVYDEATAQWVVNGSNSKTNIILPAGDMTTLTFSVSNTTSCPLLSGKRYYAEVSPTWNSDNIDMTGAISTRTYFIITGESDLAVSSYEDRALSFTGHWDKNAFENFVKLRTYSDATSYDLTKVVAFTDNFDRTAFSNPNVLIYAPGKEEYETYNVINEDGICQMLTLTAGYDFKPKAEFKVGNASFSIGSEVGRWSLVTAPFSGKLRDGSFARRIDNHKSSGISASTTTDVHNLEAGQCYLVMPSSTATNVMRFIGDADNPYTTVLTAPKENVDPAVKGTFVATEVSAGNLIINDESTQYFAPVTVATTVPGLSGYFYDTVVTKQFRVNTTAALDPAYILLAQTISEARKTIAESIADASPAAVSAFMDIIKDAEHKFSYREDNGLEGTTDVRNFAASLSESIEQYKNGSLVDAITEIADTTEPAVIGIYTLSGMQIPAVQRGINIIKMSDGTSKKIMKP